jgi:hypothetical protein
MVPPQRVTDSTGPEGSAKAIRRFVGRAHPRGRGLILMPLGSVPRFSIFFPVFPALVVADNMTGRKGKWPKCGASLALSPLGAKDGGVCQGTLLFRLIQRRLGLGLRHDSDGTSGVTTKTSAVMKGGVPWTLSAVLSRRGC